MDIAILIPESEGKHDGGTQPPITDIHNTTSHLIKQIANYTKPMDKLLGVKGKALESAILANKNILKSKTLPAIERFKGVVYDAIDYNSLDNQAKEFASKHIMICTSLFGLIPASEPIPNYKLKINKLQADKLWKAHNGHLLKEKFVIDVLPQAHKKSIHFQNGVRVEFVFRKGPKKMPAGHAGKHIKGRFIRWLCENQITNPKDILKYDEDDFHGEQKNHDTIEFTKLL